MLTITTLKNRADFLRLNRGRKFTSPYFIVRYAANPAPKPNTARVGYTVTTKCGNSVVRNRIKRRLRALVREIFPEAAREGMDYNFIALSGVKPSAADVDYDDLREAVKRAAAASAKA